MLIQSFNHFIIQLFNMSDHVFPILSSFILVVLRHIKSYDYLIIWWFDYLFINLFNLTNKWGHTYQFDYCGCLIRWWRTYQCNYYGLSQYFHITLEETPPPKKHYLMLNKGQISQKTVSWFWNQKSSERLPTVIIYNWLDELFCCFVLLNNR